MSLGRILLVDDDVDLQSIIKMDLIASQFDVITANDGETGLAKALEEKPDLVVLDINLPKLDGLSVCRQIRAESDVPILMLSSLRQDYDKIVGLEVGADDYLGKPFNPRELLARVRALLRRFTRSQREQTSQSSSDGPSECLSLDGLVLNPLSHEVTLEGELVNLTPIEFSLLEMFLKRPGQAMTRQKILDQVWGIDFVGTERTVDTHVRNLRGKIGPFSSRLESIRGVGFRLA